MTMRCERSKSRQGISDVSTEQMNFSRWIHPKTGDVRVYVHGLGANIYVVDGGIDNDCSAGFPEIVVSAKDGLNRAPNTDLFIATIAEFVKQKCPSDLNPTWADYLSLAH